MKLILAVSQLVNSRGQISEVYLARFHSIIQPLQAVVNTNNFADTAVKFVSI